MDLYLESWYKNILKKEMIKIRNPNRLYGFYNEVKRLHMTYFPDWRAGQFWMNFLGWVQNKKKRDPFFPEESEMLTYLKEYCKEKEEANG